ncbi:MAG: RNA-binding protein [Phycisphaerae bacterium]
MKKIYVGNLSRDTSEDSLTEAFTPFGAVQSATVIRDRYTGASRGFAFVEMANDEEAAAAIAGLNEQSLDGRVLTVNEAKPRVERGGGGGRGGSRGGGGGGRFR